jgi:hypothetical protein
MNTTCSINCRRCLEGYSQTMLAHTQSQISILVGLDEYSRIASDADHVSFGVGPHQQVPDPPNTSVMEEARNLIVNDAGVHRS